MSDMKFTVEGNTLKIERTFDASKQSIWAAWADPALFAQWWGPRGWSTTVKEHSFTDGGTLLYGMKCEDEAQGEWYGQESWGKMIFEDVKPYDSFGYTDFFTDNEGTVTEGMPSTKVTNELIEVENGVRFVSIGYYKTPEDLETVMKMGMEEGVRQTWDRLEEMLTVK